MIGRWIDAQDDEVLGRIVAVPEDKWVHGIDGWGLENEDSPEGAGCLITHARHLLTMDDAMADLDFDVAMRFDLLCMRFGDARIGHLISERARRVLHLRRVAEDPWMPHPARSVRIRVPTNSDAMALAHADD